MQQISFLEGLRVLSCFSIVVGHVWFFATWSHPDSSVVSFVTEFPWRYVFTSMTMGVDVFLVLSGFLMGRSVLSSQASQKLPSNFELLNSLLKRFGRLFVGYFLISAFAKYALGSHEVCFGADLTMMANLIDPVHYPLTCISVGWSTQVDYQAWLLVAALIALSSGKSKRLETLLVAVIVGFVSYKIYYAGLTPPLPPPLINIQDLVPPDQVKLLESVLGKAEFDPSSAAHMARREAMKMWIPLYFNASLRFVPFFLGFWAYLIASGSSAISFVGKQFSSFLSTLGLVGMAIVLHFTPYTPSPNYNFPSFPLYDHMFREIFSVALCAFIIGCYNNQKFPFARIFGASVFVKLGPFTYFIYLLHALIAPLMWITPPLLSVSAYSVLFNAVKLFGITFVLSLPFFFVESKAQSLVILPLLRLVFPDKKKKN